MSPQRPIVVQATAKRYRFNARPVLIRYSCTMTVPEWIRKGRELGASDLHIEADTAPVARVRGQLSTIGQPIAGAVLVQAARELLGNDGWPQFLSVIWIQQSRVGWPEWSTPRN